MAVCVCKCLNITLESESFENIVDLKKLELSALEQRDSFFSESLLSCPSSALKSKFVQPTLVHQRDFGRWTIYSCLACGQTTHAILKDRQCTVLLCKSNQTTYERINNLKKSKNYSPVFNLLVPEVTSNYDMKENIDTSNTLNSDKKDWLPTQQVIGSLSKQLSQTLQSKLEAVEETVRQFRDQKYAEFEAYRERAQREHKILACLVNKARGQIESEGRKIDASLDNGPPSPQLPPLQRRRLSSMRDAKKFSSHKKSTASVSPEDDLDTEDIFDLEGADSREISDQDYESEEGGNEGFFIPRGRSDVSSTADIARSLPINMPKFPTERISNRELDDDEEPHDIAASIKALARSVHGDVYDLPKPRFSTQI